MRIDIPSSWYDAVDKYDEGVTVGAGRPTIRLPQPTPDQAAYLAMVLAASQYDPRTIIGGPTTAMQQAEELTILRAEIIALHRQLAEAQR